MLIRKLLEEDTKKCYESISTDEELSRLDDEFYKMIAKLSDADRLEMEAVFSGYMARVTRIAYLQGMKDFQEMYIILKEDTDEILKNYFDCPKR